MNDIVLEIDNLSVEYHTIENTVYAVNGLSLSLKQGEILGLVGETGAGKTTTALSIMGLLPSRIGIVTGGNIILDGHDLMKINDADWRLIRGGTASMIFQDPMSSLNPVMNVGDQILEILARHNVDGKSKVELNAEVDKLMEMVGIPKERKVEYPHQFSGGMRQRIVIAIALACKPKLILADEPTTALDVTIQAQVLALMSDLQDKLGTSMIMITHDLGIVAETCQSVAVMYAGTILEQGSVECIFTTDKLHPYTKGLFDAIPKLNVDTDRLIPIDGLTPNPTVRIRGCPFAERCKRCMSICKEHCPEVTEVEPGHFVKCFLYSKQGGDLSNG